MELKGFETSSLFYDDANFPRGFSKSGDFTIAEADALHQYGHAMNALQNGKRKPATDEEKVFVAVCLGKQAPTSTAERAWIKYQEKLNNKISVSAFGSIPSVAKNQKNNTELIDDEGME